MSSVVAIGDLQALDPGASVVVHARALDVSDGQTLLQDHSGVLRVACAAAVAAGSWVRVEGLWREGRLELLAMEVLQASSLGVDRADSEWRWAQAPRLERLHARHTILRALRAYFDADGFLEVETPALVPSPGLEPHLDAFAVEGGKRFLHTSPEYQMKRLLCAGLPRVYQLCKAFRRDERGPLHQPEFTILEWYRSFADAAAVMRDTERLVLAAASALNGHSRVVVRGEPVDLSAPWERLTVAEAFRRHAGVEVGSLLPDEERFYRVLVERVEPALGRSRPTFLTEYPAQMASLARRSPRNPEVAERFEAYVNGIELCNGFSELCDAAEQRARLEADLQKRRALGKPLYPIDERFLRALEEGMPPSGGNALGVDRLVMLLTGARDIEEVITFESGRL